MKTCIFHRVSAAGVRLLAGMLIILSVTLSACSRMPYANILSINQVDDVLYVTARSDDKQPGYIKSFDASNYALKGKIVIPDVQKPDITSVFQDTEGLIAVVRDSRSKTYLYRVDQDKQMSSRIGIISPFAALITGVDTDYFYAISSADKKAQGINITGIRYDKTLKSQKMYHFSENPKLVVIGISEDNEGYWYVCLEQGVVASAESISALSGRMIVARRSKDGKEFRQYDYSAETLRSLSSSADQGNIWIFARIDIKDVRGERVEQRIIQFLKGEQKFITNNLPLSVIPFPHQKLNKTTEYLWAMGSQNRIYRISKKDYSYVTTALPRNLRTQGKGKRDLALFSTDDALLLGVYDIENKAYSGGKSHPGPSVMIFSKAEMGYEKIPVKATFWEGMQSGTTNCFLGAYHGCCLSPMEKYGEHDYGNKQTPYRTR